MSVWPKSVFAPFPKQFFFCFLKVKKMKWKWVFVTLWDLVSHLDYISGSVCVLVCEGRRRSFTQFNWCVYYQFGAQVISDSLLIHTWLYRPRDVSLQSKKVVKLFLYKFLFIYLLLFFHRAWGCWYLVALDCMHLWMSPLEVPSHQLTMVWGPCPT